MNTELLECKRLTVGVLYPPHNLPHSLLSQVYADITAKYPYGNLQHLPDGVRMANNRANDFFIQNGRMQINENIEYFHSAKAKAMELFSIAQSRLNISQFVACGVKLVASLPTEKGAASEAMLDTAFEGMRNKLSLLGEGFKGMGMRLVLHKDNIRQIKIEPFFGDMSSLYIEVDTQYPKNFNDYMQVESRIEDSYSYMLENIAAFIGALS